MREEQAKFKYYIIYGNLKEDIHGRSARTKAWKEFAEALKNINMELLFYGSPFGTTEGQICVLKGDITNFEKIWNPEIAPKFPITDRRTNMILV